MDYTRDYALNTNPSSCSAIRSATASVLLTASSVLERNLYSVNEQFSRVVAFLGMSKSDLARIFSVSRPALYAWLSGESVPQGINAEWIGKLHSILERIPWDGKHSLFHGYTAELKQTLMEPCFDAATVAVMFDLLWKETAERLERVSEVPLSTEPSGGTRVLDDNLLALGTEG
jgi:DNA-binding transcriptional regulator YiaG